MFTWKKLGNIFCPRNNYPWMVSHAANPFPVILDKEKIRIYFTCRDINNRSHVAFADFNADFKLTSLNPFPVIEPGQTGLFDDSGAAMGCYFEHDGKIYIYYLGWNLKVTVPWQNSIGLAVANVKDFQFKKYSRAPLLDRSEEDPFSISYPFVLKDEGKFKMWYGSNLSWGADQADMNHVVKYAESDDGLTWKRTNHICINLIHKNEYAISKPYVLKIGERYCMWYSYRANNEVTTYRIGFAESKNGIDWIRKDELAGIDISKDGWDSEMISYASVFQFNEKYYMLYNGNKFGETGFGLAIANEKH